MDMIKLSILIATIPSRTKMFNDLWMELSRQIIHLNDFNIPIEGLHDASLMYNIGIKRNKLLARATGDYVVFIDDDDHIAPDYLEKVLAACESGADCIGISGTITTNGEDERQWRISKDYGSWFTGSDGVYYRTPNHISPVRRELALQAGFPEIAFGEDHAYSMALLPLLKTEVKIEQNIYHYKYISNK